MEMFAIATRKKYRFDTTKGQLSVEELWDLPLDASSNRSDNPNLNSIAIDLYNKTKDGEPISFVTRPTSSAAKSKQTAFDTNQIKFNIVKFIIDTKMAEADKAAKAKITREKNQRIMELIAQKDDESLASKSREELLAMISASDEDAE